MLTIESPEWHDAVSAVVADATSDGYSSREADPAEYVDATVTIDILVVVYLAAQHERVASDEHLRLALSEVAAGVRSLLLCAIERAGPEETVSRYDTQDLLNDQGGTFAQDRYALRLDEPDDLFAVFQQHFHSRTRMLLRDVTRDSSVDPAITNVRNELDRTNYA